MFKNVYLLGLTLMISFGALPAFAGKSADECNAEVPDADAPNRQELVAKCLFDAASPTPPEPPPRKLVPFKSTPAGHKKAISLAMQAVRDQMKDPESAKFRNLTSSRNSNVCGEVNAKNSYGGYVGFKRFLALNGVVFMDDGGSGFIDLWMKICYENDPRK